MTQMTPEEIDAGITRLCRRFLSNVKHSVELGMQMESACRDRVVVRLVHSEKIVGNPWAGVVHGGPVLALLDQAGGLAAAARLYPHYDITPTLDLRIDHIRRPEPGIDIIGVAECHRMTSNVAFVRGHAHQGDEGNPVSTFVATYMRLSLKGISRNLAKPA